MANKEIERKTAEPTGVGDGAGVDRKPDGRSHDMV